MHAYSGKRYAGYISMHINKINKITSCYSKNIWKFCYGFRLVCLSIMKSLSYRFLKEITKSISEFFCLCINMLACMYVHCFRSNHFIPMMIHMNQKCKYYSTDNVRPKLHVHKMKQNGQCYGNNNLTHNKYYT